MPLTIIEDHAQIVNAINGFNADYHCDYLLARRLATKYLADPTPANAATLAQELSEVLHHWGAGRRRAPTVQPKHMLQATLLNQNVYALLVGFAESPISILAIDSGANRVVGGANTAANSLEFDTNLNAILTQLSMGIFIGNANVTYPLKALLLLTGFMPALDGQVRRGLGRAGFTGVNGTRFLMPTDIYGNEARKLTRLPFYLAQCYVENQTLLTAAAAASNYPWLTTEPGRLFDVLLFMQGRDKGNHQLLELSPPNRHWYDLA